MPMLSMVIVEDERTTLEGLRTLIDWESLGIRICGEAENGLAALRLLEHETIDLLLTDIRMPLMDGLQLITEIRERGWDIACVVLSGYGDFEYAQQALRLGVSDFLIKPCSPREIRSVFEKIATRLAEKQQQNDLLRGLQQRLHTSLPLVKSQLIRQWLHSPAQVTDDRQEQMKQAGLSISSEHILTLVIRMDGCTIEKLHYNRNDTELLGFAAANIVRETLEHTLRQPVEVVKEQGDIVVVINGLLEWCEPKLMEGLARLNANLDEYLRVSVSIGISQSQPSINDLCEGYREAIEALELRFYRGTGSTYFYRDLEERTSNAGGDAALWKLEQSTLEHLRSGLYAEALNDTEQWLITLQETDAPSRSQVNARTLSFLNQMAQLELEPSHSPDPLRGWDHLEEGINRTETLEELASFVYRFIRQLVQSLNPHKTPKRKVQQALDLIAEQNAMPGLSLASVSKALFVSSTYLSTLFKQELGINFLDYVHQFRIEKAKALLQSADCKIQTVAKEVGYFDEAHFTKTFKKWTGILPSQYRREHSQR
ncbi:response regulator transcription factor [Cohnella abietis]|uniref:AraC family transcriptional regulator n=1 Tax=Cohnella abietis TaxID=2507935 RepID=A0A3T1D0T2_9BACL|nr:response regulator [Cohnella abietis]BBI31615.1 AraC family transcriptional regulator [Cohnella abietis]